jgi:murein L,D-transpeptidase YafK
MKTFIFGFIFAFIFIALSIVVFYLFGRDIWYPYYEKYFIEQDVAPLECPKCPEPQTRIIERNITIVKKIEENLTSIQRLKRYLADSDFIIYPDKLTLIAIKHEKKLEVWGELNSQWRHIHDYNFTAFSGKLGPKLKEGDRQIPEGIYGISYLNPNSKFHLSMKIDYPNSFDKKMAKRDKRVNLGGDIMIHGSDKTIGCIPIGDESIEELYFLAQKVGIKNIKVILSPVDFRYMSVNIKNDRYPWLKELYANIKKEMQPFISK